MVLHRPIELARAVGNWSAVKFYLHCGCLTLPVNPANKLRGTRLQRRARVGLCGNRLAMGLNTLVSLERTQEIDDFLLFLSSKRIEMLNYFVCLAALAPVISDSLHEIRRSSVVEEEDALSDAPERSGSELVRAGATLRDAVGESFPHVVDDKVRVKIRCLIRERNARTGRRATGNLCSRGQRGRMTMDTTYLRKGGASFFAGRCGGRGSRWGQHAHEVGKGFDV